MVREPSTESAANHLSSRRLYRVETPAGSRADAAQVGKILGADLPRSLLVVVWLLWTCLASGCVRHSHTSYVVPSGGTDKFVSVAERARASAMADDGALTPRPAAPLPTLRPLPSGELDYGWHDAFLAFKAKPCTGVVEPSAKLMISRRPGPKRWVVILPIWGSSLYPPRQIARRLLRAPAAHETNVLWILGAEELFDWQAMAEAETEIEYLDIVERGADCLAAAVRDVREWIDWIQARPEHDAQRIGLVGFSIGAVAAASVVAVDSRPDATVLVMGGGRLEHVFAGCRGDARLGRDSALDHFGWSLDEFLRRTARPLAAVDPVNLLATRGPRVEPDTIFFSAATKDTCIPEISRESLWRALGQPERLQLPYGHKMSFLSMTFLGFHHTSRRIVEFLDRKLHPAPVESLPIHMTIGPE